jgi:glutamyl-tRNA synthetase
LNELAAALDLGELSRSVARFDPAELAALSARTLHGLSFEAVRESSKHMTSPATRQSHSGLPRAKLVHLLDVADWWRVVEGEIAPVVEDAEFLAAAARTCLASLGTKTSGQNGPGHKKYHRTQGAGAVSSPASRLDRPRDWAGPCSALPLIGKAKAAARLSGRAA